MKCLHASFRVRLQAAIDLLKPWGGKVHAFVASLPSVGVHALKMREAAGLGEKDKLAYLTSQVSGAKVWVETARAQAGMPGEVYGL